MIHLNPTEILIGLLKEKNQGKKGNKNIWALGEKSADNIEVTRNIQGKQERFFFGVRENPNALTTCFWHILLNTRL